MDELEMHFWHPVLAARQQLAFGADDAGDAWADPDILVALHGILPGSEGRIEAPGCRGRRAALATKTTDDPAAETRCEPA